VTSKQLVSESDDIVAEELERKKWGEWAMHASEKERSERCTAVFSVLEIIFERLKSCIKM
jgi:hypothetical protein